MLAVLHHPRSADRADEDTGSPQIRHQSQQEEETKTETTRRTTKRRRRRRRRKKKKKKRTEMTDTRNEHLATVTNNTHQHISTSAHTPHHHEAEGTDTDSGFRTRVCLYVVWYCVVHASAFLHPSSSFASSASSPPYPSIHAQDACQSPS